MSFGVSGTLRQPASGKKTDQQCRFEKIANVLNGITRGQIARLDDIQDMDGGGAQAEDSHGNDGGLTEAIAPDHGDNTKNTDCQVGAADLKLEGVPGRPADGFGHWVRDEEMTEGTTNPASGHTDPKEIQQEDLEPSFAASNALVQGKMADGYDEGQYAINEYAECNRAHSVSPSNVLWNTKTTRISTDCARPASFMLPLMACTRTSRTLSTKVATNVTPSGYSVANVAANASSWPPSVLRMADLITGPSSLT
jgi:hypothetical protein